MKEEELKLLENEFCLGCAKSCDLLHPNCERGLVKMQEILEEYKGSLIFVGVRPSL